MSGISLFAKGVCAVILICVLLEELSPIGNMKKVYRYVLSVFILVSLLSPVKELLSGKVNIFSVFQGDLDAGFSSDSLDSSICTLAAENIKNLAAKELVSKQIEYKNITVEMDITEEIGISIDRIIVTVKDYKNALSAKYIVEDALNIKTEVIIDDG